MSTIRLIDRIAQGKATRREIQALAVAAGVTTVTMPVIRRPAMAVEGSDLLYFTWGGSEDPSLFPAFAKKWGEPSVTFYGDEYEAIEKLRVDVWGAEDGFPSLTDVAIPYFEPRPFGDKAHTRVLVAKPYPPVIASTYSARCAGPAGITVLDGFECWLYQHGLRHMGEIELARGLVGLGGMTS